MQAHQAAHGCEGAVGELLWHLSGTRGGAQLCRTLALIHLNIRAAYAFPHVVPGLKMGVTD